MGFKERRKVPFSHDLKEILADIFFGEKSGEKVTPSVSAMRIRQAWLENGSQRLPVSITQYLYAVQFKKHFATNCVMEETGTAAKECFGWGWRQKSCSCPNWGTEH